MSAPRARRWTTLVVAAFALNWAWEMLQMPAYRDIPQRALGEQVLLCTVASVGDALITLAIYGAGMWLVARVGWLSRHPWSKYVIFAGLGAGAAIGGEHIALAFGLWDYGDAMPVVSFLDIGVLPLLQLTILVPMACAIALRRSGASTRCRALTSTTMAP